MALNTKFNRFSGKTRVRRERTCLCEQLGPEDPNAAQFRFDLTTGLQK